MLRVEKLEQARFLEFIEYCKKHRNELDDSFLYDDDLRKFESNDENPTFLLLNQREEVVGAASLIITDYYKRGKKARFRIFHSKTSSNEGYQLLLQAILHHTKELDQVFVFVPVVNKELAVHIEGLKFTVERYSFLLVRENIEISDFVLPSDYKIRTLQKGLEEVWCRIRNTAFANLQGSETPVTTEMISKMMEGEDYLEGGSMILYHKEQPVGIIRCADDEFENAPIMNIGPIAILPEYQGKGLGRLLLRTAICFAKQKGYEKTVLCVNADNEKAKALYIQEGFKQVEAVTCYVYDLTK